MGPWAVASNGMTECREGNKAITKNRRGVQEMVVEPFHKRKQD
jgi:hypothetical protein